MTEPTERPQDLPTSWAMARLGSLGAWFGGGTPSKDNSSYWDCGAIPWVSPKDMKVARILDTEDHITDQAVRNSATSLVPDGAVLMVTRSGILQHTFPVAVARVDVTVNQDLKALVPFGGLNSEYVAAALRAFADQVLSRCSKHGTTVQSIEFSRLKDFPIPVAPLNEQERIVAKIDELFSELDAGVASLKRAKALLKKYRQAVLKAAVTGELTRDWRERHKGEVRESGAELLQRILKARRQAWETAELKKLRAKGKPPKDDHWKQKYKEPQPPDITDLPALPEGWAVASTDQVMMHITSGSRAWSKYYGSGTGTFILAQNIRPGHLDLSARQPVDPPKNDPERARTEVHHLDVLVTIVGANTGDVCQVNQALNEHYVCQSVALLRPAIPEMYFSQLYLSADGGGQEQYKRYMYGAGRPHLSFDQLRATAIPVPSLDEQREIVELVDHYFSVFDFLEGAVEIELRRSGALRQSILKAAFAGKLVPQDPDDEPASVLLERIRAGRAARPKPARGRRRKAASRQLELLE